MFGRKLARLVRWLALSAVFFTAKQAVAQTAITFDKVFEYVGLGVDEGKIVRLVQASPTKFVLGSDQVEKLQLAGATPNLIVAIQMRALPIEASSDMSEFVIILDCSGSMNDRLADGSSKWQAARQAAIDLVKVVPEGRNLSLIVYGLDAQRQCAAVDVVRPLKPLLSDERNQLLQTIGTFQAVGHTPIARALQLAGDQLTHATGMASVVLITDGMETCHADPVAESARLVTRFPHLRTTVHVVGFCMGDREANQVSQIAAAGGGNYFDAKNAEELVAQVRRVQNRIVTPPTARKINLEVLSPLERLVIEQLSDANMDVREAAAKTIKERRMVAAVPAIIDMLANAPWGGGLSGDADRNAGIEAVLELSPEKAESAIRGALCSEKWKVRYWAACAVLNHRIVNALPATEERLLAMKEGDISATLINGTDEANMLFDVEQVLAPEGLEDIIVKLMKNPAVSVRAWATSKLSQVK